MPHPPRRRDAALDFLHGKLQETAGAAASPLQQLASPVPTSFAIPRTDSQAHRLLQQQSDFFHQDARVVTIRDTLRSGQQAKENGRVPDPRKTLQPGRKRQSSAQTGSASDAGMAAQETLAATAYTPRTLVPSRSRERFHPTAPAAVSAAAALDIGRTTAAVYQSIPPAQVQVAGAPPASPLVLLRSITPPPPQRAATPTQQRSVTPTQRSVVASQQRSVTPTQQRSVTPMQQRSVTPTQQRSVTPTQQRSVAATRPLPRPIKATDSSPRRSTSFSSVRPRPITPPPHRVGRPSSPARSSRAQSPHRRLSSGPAETAGQTASAPAPAAATIPCPPLQAVTPPPVAVQPVVPTLTVPVPAVVPTPTACTQAGPPALLTAPVHPAAAPSCALSQAVVSTSVPRQPVVPTPCVVVQTAAPTLHPLMPPAPVTPKVSTPSASARSFPMHAAPAAAAAVSVSTAVSTQSTPSVSARSVETVVSIAAQAAALAATPPPPLPPWVGRSAATSSSSKPQLIQQQTPAARMAQHPSPAQVQAARQQLAQLRQTLLQPTGAPLSPSPHVGVLQPPAAAAAAPALSQAWAHIAIQQLGWSAIPAGAEAGDRCKPVPMQPLLREEPLRQEYPPGDHDEQHAATAPLGETPIPLVISPCGECGESPGLGATSLQLLQALHERLKEASEEKEAAAVPPPLRLEAGQVGGQALPRRRPLQVPLVELHDQRSLEEKHEGAPFCVLTATASTSAQGSSRGANIDYVAAPGYLHAKLEELPAASAFLPRSCDSPGSALPESVCSEMMLPLQGPMVTCADEKLCQTPPKPAKNAASSETATPCSVPSPGPEAALPVPGQPPSQQERSKAVRFEMEDSLAHLERLRQQLVQPRRTTLFSEARSGEALGASSMAPPNFELFQQDEQQRPQTRRTKMSEAHDQVQAVLQRLQAGQRVELAALAGRWRQATGSAASPANDASQRLCAHPCAAAPDAGTLALAAAARPRCDSATTQTSQASSLAEVARQQILGPSDQQAERRPDLWAMLGGVAAGAAKDDGTDCLVDASRFSDNAGPSFHLAA
eukprot:TRINITY_DN15797_c0_g1_i1.p1 TRINITY_DN15797_c0_g1~~TRINITY_DN15797_c0_g1_i1.p1  ORF type:complete len:1059 (-),score=202.94 TRINITY_DN15797_c0_g1_i1:72-3248(-)